MVCLRYLGSCVPYLGLSGPANHLRTPQPVLVTLYGDGATRDLQELCQQVGISRAKLCNLLCSSGIDVKEMMQSLVLLDDRKLMLTRS